MAAASRTQGERKPVETDTHAKTGREAPFSGVLAGRWIAITGAGRGLGRALAITLADAGAQVVLLGRDPAALQAVADAIRARSGSEAIPVACDLSQPESIADACRRALAATPVIDVLINNGAPWLEGQIEDLADADIIATVSAAVTGTLLTTKGLLPALRRSKGADIVTIVSTSGLPEEQSGRGSVAFSAAKYGQAGISRRLQHELRAQGIRVTALYPPDFDNTDPLDQSWNVVRDPAAGERLTNRDVVATVLFVLTAPRVCAYPTIVLENMSEA